MSRSGPGGVVVAAAGTDAEGLGDGDLDVVDRAVVPQRFEDRVGEAQHQQVLHALLAQVMIDAEDLRLREHRTDGVVDGPGGFEIRADRLLEHDARLLVDEAVAREAFAHRAEQPWRTGQVEHADAVGLREQLGQRLVGSGVDGVDGDVLEPVEEPDQGLLVQLGRRDVAGEFARHLVAVAGSVQPRAGDADDAGLLGQAAGAIAKEQRGQQFTDGEISGPTEDDEIERIHGLRGGWHEPPSGRLVVESNPSGCSALKQAYLCISKLQVFKLRACRSLDRLFEWRYGGTQHRDGRGGICPDQGR